MPRPRRRAERTPKDVIAITHPDDARRNIPTAEMEPVLSEEQRQPIHLAYERRNRDLDPQLVWRGKDEQDAAGILTVAAPPLFTQEKVHPKVLVDDLMRLSCKSESAHQPALDLFADFNGLHDPNARTEFYQHDQNWANRMILGDSLQVMASLAEREWLRGKVQCIYIDPPYGIKFNSNFQWSTTSRDVRDGNAAHITREPEQVKAFRDTWSDGIHSYLTYLRDRLTVARDLLADSGSVFVQIGDENVHRVRAVMDEVFGEDNFISVIAFQTTTGFQAQFLGNMSDFVIWYCKNKGVGKSRNPFYRKGFQIGEGNARWLMFNDFTYRGVTAIERRQLSIPEQAKPYKPDNILSQGRAANPQPFQFRGKTYDSWDKNSHWKANYPTGMERLARAGRIHVAENSIQYVRYHTDFDAAVHGNIWTDTGTGNFTDDKTYVVQTNSKVIERCILMTTDPGDLVLDPTCGSGTTAYVAEQWGRRWITIDTSRVALALARARVMGARYPYYLLADSPEGQRKEAEIRRREITEAPTLGNLRQGFVYERVPHITLRDIANNAEIDVIWETAQRELEPLQEALNAALSQSWQEWEIPREARDPWPDSAASAWLIVAGLQNAESDRLNALRVLNQGLGREYTLDDVPDHPSDPWDPEATELHRRWWEGRIVRQREIDASIAANARFEYLYDKPYEDSSKTRVAGPFTVESLSPHRVMASGDGERAIAETGDGYRHNGDLPVRDFGAMILENLRTSGVQQSSKQDKISFTSLTGWPGHYVCADGRFTEGESESPTEHRAAIFIGPEFGTVQRADLTAAAREAAEAGFDLLIACAFSYDAHAAELTSIGALPVLKARMNADLHMADTLKNDSRGNLFVIFGEPDIEMLDAGTDAEDREQVRVKINGVDIFDPSTGQVRSDDTDGIACWFVDTDYNEESFFVRQAYFLGASNDPYKALKTTLKAEIDEDAWATLRSDTSRPFPKPDSGRIAVKVINHLGDEAMKVLRV